MIKRIDHIGIVVNDINEALTVYQQALGLRLAGIRERSDQEATIALLLTGESGIELIQPIAPDSNVADYLQKRGEGIHHICLEVDDIDRKLADLEKRGLQLVDEVPRIGPTGERFAFIHPRSAHGVLIELYEYRESETPDDSHGQ